MKLKRLLALIFSAILPVSMMGGTIIVSAADNAFSDVTADHPYVTALQNAGIVEGYAGKFNGDGTVTRACLATFIAKTYGLTGKSSLSFPDVDNNVWYSNYVKLAVANGYMKTLDDYDTFLPDKLVTCEDLFLLIEAAVKADNTFRPDPKAVAPLIADFSAPVTRYQVAYAMYEIYNHKHNPKPMPGKMVVGYYGNWQAYSLLKPAEIPWNMLTHLNHGFLTVSDGTPSDDTFGWAAAPEYSLAFTDSWADIWMNAGAGDGGIFKVYERMHRIYPNVRIMISVGGWSRGEMFSEMASKAENRAIFINSCIDMMNKNPWIGGIDIDWEYPGVSRDPVTDGIDDPVDFGSGVNSDVTHDKENFTALLKEMREAMDKAGLQDKQLTICESADYANTAARQNLDEIAKYVDFVNVMTYDMTGAYDNTTGFHAAVYANPYTPFSTDQAITGYLKHFKPAQLNVGVATYSRGWANVVPDRNGELRGQPAGTWKPAPDTGHPDADVNSRYYRGDGDSATGKYEIGEGWSAGKHKATDMPEVIGKWYGLYPGACFRLETVKNMMKDTGRYTYYYDEQAEAPYLYDSKDKVFLSFEDERSAQAKVDYVLAHDLGGLMYWETSTDIKPQGFPITKVLYDGVCK